MSLFNNEWHLGGVLTWGMHLARQGSTVLLQLCQQNMKKKDILVTRKHPGSTEPTKGPYLTTCTSSLQTLYFTQLIRWREIGQVGTSNEYSNALIVFIIYDQNQNNLIETTEVDQQNFNKGVQPNLIPFQAITHSFLLRKLLLQWYATFYSDSSMNCLEIFMCYVIK